MNTTLATCKHTYDNGGNCNSAAARGRDYCVYHLRYRARLLRMAQARARNERFDLKLPPLEDMFAVQSALNQLVEAVAADMLDLKRANFLLSALRAASKNLLARDKWPASIAHSDHPAAVDVAAEYGLPEDLDLNTPPEVAFPPPAEGAPPLSPSFGDRVGNAAGARIFSDLPPMPKSGYCSEHGYDCPDLVIRADHPVTPEMVEIVEISDTQGADAAARRGNQLERNRQRRQLRSERKRFAAIALEKNMRLAAERLAEQKLAEKLAQRKVEAAQEGASPAAGTGKKPPAPADQFAPDEAKMTA